MKVLHVVENLDRGGLERVVIELVGAQVALGYECEVACLFEPGALAGELLARGIRVHHCGKRRGLDMRALLRLRRVLRSHRGGVLHSHNAAAHYHMVLAGTGMRFRRVLTTRHGMGASDSRDRKERRFRRAARATDYVVSVCDAVQRKLARQALRPRAGLVVVPNGIRLDLVQVSNPAQREALAEELGFPSATSLVGTVGRLDGIKNHALLLQAFAALLEKHSGCGLVIAGDGPLREALEAQAGTLGIAEQVRFLGHQPEIGRLLSGLSVFALCSSSEGYSLALLEACAAGLPAVVTDVGGNSEIVRDGFTGVLVHAQDAESISRALACLLGDPARAAAMGAQARRWALDHATLDEMVQRYACIYDGKPFTTVLEHGCASVPGAEGAPSADGPSGIARSSKRAGFPLHEPEKSGRKALPEQGST